MSCSCNVVSFVIFLLFHSCSPSDKAYICVFSQSVRPREDNHQDRNPSTQEDAGFDPFIWGRWGLWDSPNYQIPAAVMPWMQSHGCDSVCWIRHKPAVATYCFKTARFGCFSCCSQRSISVCFCSILALFKSKFLYLLLDWNMGTIFYCYCVKNTKGITKCLKIDFFFSIKWPRLCILIHHYFMKSCD